MILILESTIFYLCHSCCGINRKQTKQTRTADPTIQQGYSLRPTLFQTFSVEMKIYIHDLSHIL